MASVILSITLSTYAGEQFIASTANSVLFLQVSEMELNESIGFFN